MKFLISVLMLAAFSFPNAAQAWNASSCDGKIIGMQNARTFLIDRCNIPVLSARYNDITYAVGEWNRIEGVKDVFKLRDDDDDCKLEGDDFFAFVDQKYIDGYAGMTRYEERACYWPYNRGDGRRYDIEIYIGTQNFGIGSSQPRDTHHTIRSILFHEMGHALGGEHDNEGEPNMLWDPNNSPRVGNRNHRGQRLDKADSFMPNDIDFAVRWYNESGSGMDVAISGQGWSPATFVDNNSVRPTNLNTTETVRGCPNDNISVGFSHMILGENDVPCEIPYIIKFYLSPDSFPENDDYEVASWSVCGKRGQRFVNNAILKTPTNVPAGTYNVMAIVDPADIRKESSEFNNAMDLGLNVRVPAAANRWFECWDFDFGGFWR